MNTYISTANKDVLHFNIFSAWINIYLFALSKFCIIRFSSISFLLKHSIDTQISLLNLHKQSFPSAVKEKRDILIFAATVTSGKGRKRTLWRKGQTQVCKKKMSLFFRENAIYRQFIDWIGRIGSLRSMLCQAERSKIARYELRGLAKEVPGCNDFFWMESEDGNDIFFGSFVRVKKVLFQWKHWVRCRLWNIDKGFDYLSVG